MLQNVDITDNRKNKTVHRKPEEIVGNYYCGFRRRKSTTDPSHTLRQIMSKYYEFGKDFHDSSNNSVDREELWKTLVILGIPNKYANIIKKC